MASEFALILAPAPSPDSIVAAVFPDPAGQPVLVDSGRTATADLTAAMGIFFSIRHGTRGYFEAEEGSGLWTWEPQDYLNLGFRFDNDFPRDQARRHMLRIVGEVLAVCQADAALILNGDVLLLRRIHGVLERHPGGGFWDSLDSSDIPGTLGTGH